MAKLGQYTRDSILSEEGILEGRLIQGCAIGMQRYWYPSWTIDSFLDFSQLLANIIHLDIHFTAEGSFFLIYFSLKCLLKTILTSLKNPNPDEPRNPRHQKKHCNPNITPSHIIPPTNILHLLLSNMYCSNNNVHYITHYN